MPATRLLFVGAVLAALPGLVFGGADIALRGGLVNVGVEVYGMSGSFKALALGTSMTADVVPRLGIGGEIDWWYKSESGYGMTATLTDLAFSGIAKFKALEEPVILAAGAGLGMHVFLAVATGYGAAADVETEYGIHLLGEIGVPTGPRTALLAQVKYAMVELAGMDMNMLYLTAGVQFGS